MVDLRSRPGGGFAGKSTEEISEIMAKRFNAAKFQKEKLFKELVDRIFATGNFDLFKAQVTESQKRAAERAGKVRKGTGIIPAQYIKQFNKAMAAGVDSPEFKDILRITGRSTEDILKLNELRPGGKVGVKIRAAAAAESFPESRKKTEKEKLESQQKTRTVRAEKEAVGKKYASEAELQRFKTVNKQKEKLNKFFKNKPNAINNTEFGKEIKKLMDVRIDKDGNFFQKTRHDSYYVEKARKGQIFDIFDINKIEKGQRITKQTINLNITPSQFNEGFIEGQVDRYFKKGGRLEGNTDKLKNVDEYLKSIGVKVDIGDVGRIGGGNKVFYESATGKFPHIYDTLKNLKIPDTLLRDINPTIDIPGITKAADLPVPEKTKTREMFETAFKKVPKKGKLGVAAAITAGLTGKAIADEELPIKYNDEIGAFVDPKTDDKVSQSTLLDWAANNPMPTAAVASAPLLSKTVRKGAGKLLKGLLSTLGSSAAGLGFAGMTVKSNLDEGKNIVDATVDPLVGVELLFPEAAKRFGGKGLQNALGRVLSLGRVGAMMTPVGAGITALGLGKMGIEAAMDEREKILGMTEEEKTNYLADQYESFGGVFGEGA